MKSLPVKNLIRKPGRTAALMLLTAFLALAVFGGSLVVLSLRQGLNSLEARLGADIIVVPSEAQSKVSFQNMFLQGTTGAFYMDAENLKRVREIEGVEKAAPQIFLASLKADCCSVKIQVIGFDPQADFTVQPWIAQSYARELGEMDVVVGCKVEAGVGEILRIYDQRCKVVGRLAATGTGLDTAVYCNLDTIRLLLQAAEEKGVSHKVTSDSTGPGEYGHSGPHPQSVRRAYPQHDHRCFRQPGRHFPDGDGADRRGMGAGFPDSAHRVRHDHPGAAAGICRAAAGGHVPADAQRPDPAGNGPVQLAGRRAGGLCGGAAGVSLCHAD